MKNINDHQVRHEMLIDFLSQFEQYQSDGKPSLPKVKKELSSDKVKKIIKICVHAAKVVTIL